MDSYPLILRRRTTKQHGILNDFPKLTDGKEHQSIKRSFLRQTLELEPLLAHPEDALLQGPEEGDRHDEHREEDAKHRGPVVPRDPSRREGGGGGGGGGGVWHSYRDRQLNSRRRRAAAACRLKNGRTREESWARGPLVGQCAF